jgi:RimJ/RimL family protein N-acetyltransferase
MIPTLTTDRLVLRAPTLADFEPYAAYFASPRSVHDRGGPKSRGEAWKEFAAPIAQWSLKGYGAWSVEDRATGSYAGEVGIFHPADFPEPELGWALMEPFECRGLACEAAVAARAWTWDTLGLASLVSYIDPGNARSIRLAERLGARLDRSAAKSDPEDLVYRHEAPA